MLPDEVREGLDAVERSLCANYLPSAPVLGQWQTIRAHLLAQPAQVVDVGAKVADAWRDAAAACLGKHSRLFRYVCEEADKLTRALGNAQAEGWKPIETAPKDGTQVLTYAPKRTWATRHIDINYFKRGVWQHCNSECPPTHWQPLPTPPQPEE